jgi:hypothetical protein
LSPEMIKSAFKAEAHSMNLSSSGSFSTILSFAEFLAVLVD